jgi:hypothetical protein
VVIIDLDLGTCTPAPGSPDDDSLLLPWREQLDAALAMAYSQLRSPTEYESNPFVAGGRALGRGAGPQCWARVLRRLGFAQGRGRLTWVLLPGRPQIPCPLLQRPGLLGPAPPQCLGSAASAHGTPAPPPWSPAPCCASPPFPHHLAQA